MTWKKGEKAYIIDLHELLKNFHSKPKIIYMLKKITGGNKKFNIFNWKTSYPFEFWTDQIIEQNKL